MAFNDAKCKKCGAKISWLGKLTDKPVCPKCGEKPDLVLLKKIEDEIEAAVNDPIGYDDYEKELIERCRAKNILKDFRNKIKEKENESKS